MTERMQSEPAGRGPTAPAGHGLTAIVVKGYPRLSETFIAQEILGLQQLGQRQLIVSLRHPTDTLVHDLNRRITAPVLAIQGEDDPYGTLAQIEEIAPAGPISDKLVLRNCGHSPHRDQPDATIEAIAGFLARL